MQSGQLIVNYLTKTNAMVLKDENMLGKVIKQLKLEKANSRALTTQKEEFKNIFVKIGVDTNDRSTVQKLLQSAKLEIYVLKKNLKLPTGEHSMAAKVAEVENEKEKLLEKTLQKEEDQTALSLQNHIESHTCTFVLPSGTNISIDH